MTADIVPPTRATRFAGYLDRLAEPRVFALAVVGYYAVAYLIRTLVLTGSTGDEAQLMLYAQTLALGYDLVNLPSVGWLGALVDRLLGPGLGVALLPRYGVLAIFFVICLAAAREALEDRRLALAAAVAPIGFFFLGWESLRNFVDSLMLIATLMATVAVVLRLARVRSREGYVLLALVMAAGLLSKYNYLPALAALAIAGYATPVIRPVFADRRFLLGLAAAAAAAAPTYIWVASRLDVFLDTAGSRLVQEAGNPTDSPDRLATLLAVPDAAAGFVLPLVPLALLIFGLDYFRRVRDGSPAAAPVVARWLGLYIVVLLLGATAVAAIAGIERVREHYMFVLVPLPLWFAAMLPRDGIDRRRIDFFIGTHLLLAVVALGALAAQVIEVRDCDKCRLVMPWRNYAQQLRDLGFERGTIVSFDSAFADIGPNLRRFLPETRVWSSKRPYVDAPPLSDPGSCLVVWSHTSEPWVLERIRRQPVPEIGVPMANARVGLLQATLLWTDRPAPAVGYALIEAGAGACR